MEKKEETDKKLERKRGEQELAPTSSRAEEVEENPLET